MENKARTTDPGSAVRSPGELSRSSGKKSDVRKKLQIAILVAAIIGLHVFGYTFVSSYKPGGKRHGGYVEKHSQMKEAQASLPILSEHKEQDPALPDEAEPAAKIEGSYSNDRANASQIIIIVLVAGILLTPMFFAFRDIITGNFEGPRPYHWIPVVFFLSPVGAVLYFAFGRKGRISRQK